MKQGYEVDGTKVSSLAEVATLLGVSRVSRKDLKEGVLYPQVTLCDMSDMEDTSDKADTSDVTQESPNKDTVTAEEGTEEAKESDEAQESAKEPTPVEVPDKEPTPVEEPAKVTEEPTAAVAQEEAPGMTIEEARNTFPKFDTLDALKEFITDMDTPTLEYMLTSLGGTWDKHDNPAINRMRIAQGLHRVYFPQLFKPTSKSKKKAKYGDFTTEQLKQMSASHKLVVPLSGHEPIDRMRLIMTLKAGGYLPE